MNIESQVCSLELAKRLKELGIKRDSLFYYQNNPYNDGQDCMDFMISECFTRERSNAIINSECENDNNPKYAAFTSTELGEMLPSIGYGKLNRNNKWVCNYSHTVNPHKKDYYIEDESEANARAKMLIHLIENNLIKVEDINNAIS